MESNDHENGEKIESQLNANWKTAMEQFQSDIDQYGEDFGSLVKNFPPPGRILDSYSNEEKQDMLDKIFESYPESYMAARSVFMKIFEAFGKDDFEEAEKCDDALLEVYPVYPVLSIQNLETSIQVSSISVL